MAELWRGIGLNADLLHLDWDIILILSHLFLLLFLIQSVQIVEQWLTVGEDWNDMAVFPLLSKPVMPQF